MTTCAWPGCTKTSDDHGREFMGGRLCDEHTAESHERDADALDAIAQARDEAAWTR